MPTARTRSIVAHLAALGVTPTRVATDSRSVQAGDLFIALPGARHDGRQFIPQAIAAGAAAVLWELRGFAWNPTWQVPNLPVDDLRAELGPLAAVLCGEPSRAMWVAGVTGTNGKTSCSHWIAQALTLLGRRAAVIGTLGSGFPGALSDATHTTPDAAALQRELARLRQQGADSVAMEVSSHGLDQGRVNGVAFDAALFTNLSRDHLDYHGSMDRYGEAKTRLFRWPNLKFAVINLDDAFGAGLAASLDRRRTTVLGYGLGKGEISGHRLDLSTRGLSLEIETPWGPSVIRSALLGGFNAHNLMGVLGMLLAAGAELEQAAQSLRAVRALPGRLELVRVPGRPLVVVDYAHSPDALEKVLAALRELRAPGARLLCVFGCGGDRDRGKRPLMGEIATRMADQAIITSDNPRTESPHAIIAEIVAGAHANHETQVDRATAILRAVQQSGPQDIVLIAGKGHEAYQEIAGVRVPFSDAETARRALQVEA
jgi:UDP-N-acetylmuramoyl-L-alanyl-D-glutamate--2,6-diaminopimelate ligase